MRRPPRPLALAYHGVDRVPLRQDRHGLFVPASTVKRHIGWLRRFGYRLVTFSELARHVAAGEGDGLCALTFDDGFSDNLYALLPVLESEQVPATVFVVSSWMGNEHPDAPWARTLTPDELRRLAGGPVEIGSHSRTHRNLAALSYDEVVEEFAESKRALEGLVGAEVTAAAYPYGYATAETARACAASGFAAACRISGLGSWSDPMQLPREDVHNFTNLVGFHLKMRGAYEPLMRFKPAKFVRNGVRKIRKTIRVR